MTKWAPAKSDTQDALAAEILQHYGHGRVLVAVDGLAGTADFAEDLAAALRRAGHQVFHASIAAFHRPRALRYPAGSDAPEPGYDVDTLKRVLTDPFRDGGTGSFVLAAFDAQRDAPIEPKWITAKPDAILLVDGALLQTPDLRGLWHYTVWVDTPAEATPEQAAYLTRTKPAATATAIIDNSDAEHPRRRFADSC